MASLCQTAFMLTAALLALVAAPAYADRPDFRFPVTCTLLADCWITNHVDLDDRAGRISDYMCGDKATDNNKSTHISLANRMAVERGVPVTAAAAGTVAFADLAPGPCGVRVTIDHEAGWTTHYCHLNPESIAVSSGDAVQAGNALGTIGLSGQTVWPRLSFSITRNGMVFDPYSGRTPMEGCSLNHRTPLWAAGHIPPYEPASITGAGFTVGMVRNEDILNGTVQSATVIDTQTPQLSLWMMIMNVRKDDRISMTIRTPSGRILNEQTQTAGADTDYYPLFFSTLRRGFLWDEGVYEGVITITRRVAGEDVTSGRIVRLRMIEQTRYNR